VKLPQTLWTAPGRAKVEFHSDIGRSTNSTSTNRQATALAKFTTPSQEKPDPPLVKQETEKLAKKFMVVGAITRRGVLPLIKVPPKVKINSKQ